MFALSVSGFAQQRPAHPPLPEKANPHAIKAFTPLDFRKAAADEAKKPKQEHDEIENIDEPQPPPPIRKGLPVGSGVAPASASRVSIEAAPSFGTGVSPGPKKTFKAEFLSSTSIPPTRWARSARRTS